MTLVLLALGAALVVFGGVVLIRYADRPGGDVKWLGLEVSSKGAGLPLVALGVACIAIAATQRPNGPRPPGFGDTTRSTVTLTDTGPTAGSCRSDVFRDVAPDRIVAVERGMQSVPVIAPPQPIDPPVGVILTDGGARVAALRLKLHRGPNYGADLYRVEAAVDGACASLTGTRNASRGGDPTALTNWDTFHFRSAGREYDVRVGGEGGISVGSFTAVP